MTQSSFIVDRVDSVLARTLQVARQKWVSVEADLGVVFDEIELLSTTGKRLRPQFAHWGWVAAGGQSESSEPDEIGAAIELLHIFALFHDDVIDDAGTRRGIATTHVRRAEVHSQNKWAGESRRFGDGSAVLIGDIAYVISDQLMDALSPPARSFWHDLRFEMNVGQYLDTIVSARRATEFSAARQVAIYKTAKYTIERPLHIGAVAAHAERGTALLPMFSAYGLSLGEAFQMRDDILGAFGDAAVTGKPVGGDFLEGKRTPLLAYAYENASHMQRKVLDTVGEELMNVEQVQEVVLATGAVTYMESRISQLHDEAVNALQESELAGDAYAELVVLAEVATKRQR